MNLHPTAHLIAEYLRAKPAQAPECLAPTLTLPGVPIAAPAARQTPARAIRCTDGYECFDFGDRD